MVNKTLLAKLGAIGLGTAGALYCARKVGEVSKEVYLGLGLITAIAAPIAVRNVLKQSYRENVRETPRSN